MQFIENCLILFFKSVDETYIKSHYINKNNTGYGKIIVLISILCITFLNVTALLTLTYLEY